MSPSITETIAQKRTQAERGEREKRNGENQKRAISLSSSGENSAEDRKKEALGKIERIFKDNVLPGLEEIDKKLLSGIREHEIIFLPEKSRVILVWGNRYGFNYHYDILGDNIDCSVIKVFLKTRDRWGEKITYLDIQGEKDITVDAMSESEREVAKKYFRNKCPDAVMPSSAPFLIGREFSWGNYYHKRGFPDIETEILIKHGEKYFSSDPIFDQDKIKNALAECYLKPKRYHGNYNPSDSSFVSSLSSSNCECCCECSC